MTLTIKTSLLGVLCASVLLVASPQSHAYEVTDTYALRLNEQSALYVVIFRFGFLNRETYVPRQAAQNYDTGIDTIGFTLVDSAGAPLAGGLSIARVISNASTTNNNYYHIPDGRNREFAITALVDTTNIAQPAALKITHLPFTLDNKGEIESFKLRENELVPFITQVLR